MYMRVRHVRYDPAKLDEGIALSLEVHAALRQRPGFQSGMIALDRTTGEAFAVSTWDTEEHAGFPAVLSIWPGGTKPPAYKSIHPRSSRSSQVRGDAPCTCV
jgi:hypothetical protein